MRLVSIQGKEQDLRREGRTNAGKALALLLALSPLLTKYASPLPGINFGELFLIVGLFVISMRNPIRMITHTPLDMIWMYVAYIWLLIPITSVYYKVYLVDVAVRTVRFTAYVLILLISAEIIDWHFYLECIKRIVYINIGFLIVQYIVYYLTGRYFQGYGYLLKLSAGISAAEKERVFAYSYFRPSALFLEPSHLCQYMYPILNYTLFKDNKDMRSSVIISIGILLSTSLWGYLIMCISWMIYFLRLIMNSDRVKFNTVGFSISLGLILMVAYSFSGTSNTIERIDFTDVQGSAAFSGRFMTYADFTSYSFAEKLLGRGFGYIGNLEAIGNSLAYILLGSGLFGTLMVFSWLISLIRSNDLYGKATIGEYILLIFGSTTFNSLYLPVTILASMDCYDETD